ncbi:MAG TPA: YncE family protein [Patescibacteria group bacterium]|nr:YncE family protein [Patescibacteria group bacterium]
MKHAWNSKFPIFATIVTGFLFLSAAAFAAGNPASPSAAAGESAAAAAGPSGYHLLKSIPIPGSTPWDYLTYQDSTHRLFIAHGTHVVVVNTDTGKIVGNIGGMTHIHCVVFAPEFNRGFVTDGGAHKLWIFNLRTLKVIGSAPTDPDSDGAVYDPVSKRVFTFNGDPQSSTVVDARTGKVVGHIELGGDPEFPVADGRGHIYDNIAPLSQIVEIDSHTMKILHRWPVAPGQHPTGLAIDLEHHILFSGCRGLMVMMNADTGKVIATEPIGTGVDATRFDPATGFAFASNGGSGDLTVIHEDSPVKFHVVENVPTEAGARTMALDRTTHRVFLVTAKLVRIAHPKPHTVRPFRIVPGTFHLLIFGRD